MGGIMPIPWDAIRRYARHQGLRKKDDVDHFTRLVMAVDDEFRAAVSERQERGKDENENR